MIIKNLTGYMLGNRENAPEVGKQWWPYDVQVFVCANMDKAKEILMQSRKYVLNPDLVWTTIYRVQAKDIECQKIENNLIWTKQPTKIIVDSPVFFSTPRYMNEQDLLNNARRIMPRFSRTMCQAFIDREEKTR